jgi:hypothetical protein
MTFITHRFQETALKIQFLRIVLHFCDRDRDNQRNKALLLDQSDEARIKNLTHSPPLYVLKRDPSHSEGGGLIWKLVTTLMDLPPISKNGGHGKRESALRFWVASCIEGWLRGSKGEYQLYITSLGLLSYLIDAILSHKKSPGQDSEPGKSKEEGKKRGEKVEGKEKESDGDGEKDDADDYTFLQTSFDLLGELLKFNCDVYRIFENYLTAAQVSS